MVKIYEDLYYEPIQILECLGYDKAEMSGEQLAFLCELIKQHKPKKIVEVGVAAGGTTSVILQCIKKLDYNTQMFSLDLNDNFYRDANKKTGYLIDKCKEGLGNFNHTLLTGKYAVECLERIGSNIDFLILDTVHSLPGELLDFLAFFPFLNVGSVVVLHDIYLCHNSNNLYAFATKVLLDAVVAEKMIPISEGGDCLGIGAFIVTENTGKDIANIFSALSITWRYIPQDRELQLYRKFYTQHYSKECVLLFDMAVKLNVRTVEKELIIKKNGFVRTLKHISKLFGRSVYIYGCGKWGQQFYTLFRECGIELKGYIISDGKEKPNLIEEIYYLSEIQWDIEKDIIYIGVNADLQTEICSELDKRSVYEYLVPDDIMYSYLVM